MQITARPTGPQPITIATSRFPTSPRRTAWRPTAIGSVSAPRSAEMPFGTGHMSDSSTTIRSAYAPGASVDSPIPCTSPPRRSSGIATTGAPAATFLRARGP
jgi:hypothetical protein